MARPDRPSATLPGKLPDSLEKRLDLLSRTLDDAEIADKSIDILPGPCRARAFWKAN